MEGAGELLGEFGGGVGAGGEETVALGEVDEIEVGIGEVEHPAGTGTGGGGARSFDFDVENSIAAVGEDDGCDVDVFSGEGPEGGESIHGAAVGLESKDGTRGGGDGGAEGDGQALTDGTTGDGEKIVGSGAGEAGVDGFAAGDHLVGEDGTGREEGCEDVADQFGSQGLSGVGGRRRRFN